MIGFVVLVVVGISLVRRSDAAPFSCPPIRTPDAWKPLVCDAANFNEQAAEFLKEKICGMTTGTYLATLPSLLEQQPLQMTDGWDELLRQYIAARLNVFSGCEPPPDVDLDAVGVFLAEHCQTHSLDNDYLTSEVGLSSLERLAAYNQDTTVAGRTKTCEHCSRAMHSIDVDRYAETVGNESWCDIIIVGGYGTGGALHANRWAKAYPNKEVCIVDVGERIYNATEWQKCPTCVVSSGAQAGEEMFGTAPDVCDIWYSNNALALSNRISAMLACDDRVSMHKSANSIPFSSTGQSFVHEGKTSSHASLSEAPIHQPRGSTMGGTSLLNGEVTLRPTVHLLQQFAELLGNDTFAIRDMIRVAKLIENRNQHDVNGFAHFDNLANGFNGMTGFDPRYHSRHVGDLDLCALPQYYQSILAAKRALRRVFGSHRFNDSNMLVHPDTDLGAHEALARQPPALIDTNAFSACFDRSLNFVPGPDCTAQAWLNTQSRLVWPLLGNSVGALHMQPPYALPLAGLQVKDIAPVFGLYHYAQICAILHPNATNNPALALAECSSVTRTLNYPLGRFLPVWSNLFAPPPAYREDSFSAFLGRHFFFPNGDVAPTTPCGGDSAATKYCTKIDGTNVRVYERAYATHLAFEDELDGQFLEPTERPDPRRVIGIKFYPDGRNVYRVGRTRENTDPLVPKEAVNANAEAAQAAGESALYARLEVIVAMNAFDTPALFQRSGVARFEDLDRIDASSIPRRLNLPGVGHHLHDHTDLVLVGSVRLNPTVAQRPPATQYFSVRFKSSESKSFSNTHAFVSPMALPIGGSLYRNFTSQWGLNVVGGSHQISSYNINHWPQMRNAFPPRPLSQTVEIFFEQQQSVSTGAVRIWSADPTQPPVIESLLVANERDFEDMEDAIINFAIPMFESGLSREYEQLVNGTNSLQLDSNGKYSPTAAPQYFPYVVNPVTGATLTETIPVTDPALGFTQFVDYLSPNRSDLFTAAVPPKITDVGVPIVEACNDTCRAQFVYPNELSTRMVTTPVPSDASLVYVQTTNSSAERCIALFNAFRNYDPNTWNLTLNQTQTCVRSQCISLQTCSAVDISPGGCSAPSAPSCFVYTRTQLVLTYEYLDRQKIRNAINKYKFSGYHASGSMKMGRAATDPYAVLDAQGRVYGMKGVSVADSSVLPISTDVNTMMPTYMFSHRTYELRCRENEVLLGLVPSTGTCEQCPLDQVDCKVECFAGAEIPRYSVPGPYSIGYQVFNYTNFLGNPSTPMYIWYPSNQLGADLASYPNITTVPFIGIEALGFPVPPVTPNAFGDFIDIAEALPSSASKFPVVVYIHGSGVTSAADTVRIQEHLASHGIVVVAPFLVSASLVPPDAPPLRIAHMLSDLASVTQKLNDAAVGAGSDAALSALLDGEIEPDAFEFVGFDSGGMVASVLANTLTPAPLGVVLIAPTAGIVNLSIVRPDVPAQWIVSALDVTTNNAVIEAQFETSLNDRSLLVLDNAGHLSVPGDACSRIFIPYLDLLYPLFTNTNPLDVFNLRYTRSDGCPNGTASHDSLLGPLDQIGRLSWHSIVAHVFAAFGIDAPPSAQMNANTLCYFDDFVNASFTHSAAADALLHQQEIGVEEIALVSDDATIDALLSHGGVWLENTIDDDDYASLNNPVLSPRRVHLPEMQNIDALSLEEIQTRLRMLLL